MNIQVTDQGVFINGHRAHRIFTGSDRACYVADGIIVKRDVERMGFNCRQCRHEWRIWQRIDSEDRKYFVSPIAHGPDWIAQRVMKFKRGRKPRWAWELAEQLADKYGILNDCREYDGSFVIGTNWGITQSGQLVIYDWGV